MIECPYCGSQDVEYLGYDDGGGDYGDMITPVFRCYSCDQAFDGPGGVRIVSDDLPDLVPGTLAHAAHVFGQRWREFWRVVLFPLERAIRSGHGRGDDLPF